MGIQKRRLARQLSCEVRCACPCSEVVIANHGGGWKFNQTSRHPQKHICFGFILRLICESSPHNNHQSCGKILRVFRCVVANPAKHKKQGSVHHISHLHHHHPPCHPSPNHRLFSQQPWQPPQRPPWPNSSNHALKSVLPHGGLLLSMQL